MSFFDEFDRYIDNRMNQFFNDPFFSRGPFAGAIEGNQNQNEQNQQTQGRQVANAPNNREKSLWPHRQFQGWNQFKVDLTEKDNQVLVRAELPGVPKESINVHVDQGVLTIQAESKEEHEENQGTRHLKECSYGKVQRSLRLPESAVTDNSQAKFENGVLSLVFPKNPEKETRRMIKIA